MSNQIIIIAAHPDDETGGLGGTIASHVRLGDSVFVQVLTDGVTARHDTTKLQQAAAREACAALDVDNVRTVGPPNQHLDGMRAAEVFVLVRELVK